MQRTRRRAGHVVPVVVSGVLALLSMAWFAANAAGPWGPGWLGWIFAPLVIMINQAQSVRLRHSPGMTPESRPGDGPGELVRRADVAMYAAKAAGKGRNVRYEPSTDVPALAVEVR
jgi:GGDEF domain-containing protein